MKSIDALGLIVGAGRQPVVKHADTAANGRRPAGKGRPGDPEARADVREVVNVRLELVAKPRCEREIFADANVVLNVETGLHILDKRSLGSPIRRV